MMRKKGSPSPSSSSSSSSSAELSDDPDTEEALKGFDFLASNEDMEGSPESPATGDLADWGKTSIRVVRPPTGFTEVDHD